MKKYELLLLHPRHSINVLFGVYSLNDVLYGSENVKYLKYLQS